DPELARDWAVGLIGRARTLPESFQVELSRRVAPLLQEAVHAHPEDVGARESLGIALAWQGSLQPALATCAATLARAPRREWVLCDAGIIAQQLGQGDRSLGYWQRALAVNPLAPRYRFEVAKLLAQGGDWAQAVTEAKRVLAQNGSHVNSR